MISSDGSIGFMNRTEGAYKKLLAFSLRHGPRSWGLPCWLFLGGLGITNFVGKEFVPPEDQGRFIIRMQVPVDYSVDEADRMFRRAEEILPPSSRK